MKKTPPTATSASGNSLAAVAIEFNRTPSVTPRRFTSAQKTYAAISDQALVDLTRQLIAIPSPNFEEGAVADFIGERMTRTGMDVQMMPVEHPDQPGKVTRQPIGRLRGAGGGPTLMFNGHLDVAAMMPGWSVDPLKGKFEDGWIWGHGAQDDKGGLAAALVGIEAIVATGTRGCRVGKPSNPSTVRARTICRIRSDR